MSIIHDIQLARETADSYTQDRLAQSTDRRVHDALRANVHVPMSTLLALDYAWTDFWAEEKEDLDDLVLMGARRGEEW